MLPILEPLSPDALPHARDLGFAFQLTNFLRDVGEDLDRGRVYVPEEDLDRFGADPRRRVVDQGWRQLMAFEVERCRELYRSADRGIALLPASAARCITSGAALVRRHPRRDRGCRIRRVPRPGSCSHMAQSHHGCPHGDPDRVSFTVALVGAGLSPARGSCARVATPPPATGTSRAGRATLVVPARTKSSRCHACSRRWSPRPPHRTRSSSSTTGPRTARPWSPAKLAPPS